MKRQILRKLVLTVSLLAVSAALSVAAEQPAPQSRSSRWEEIQNMKIAFFTDALQLTTEQSQKFWPVYNEYWKARQTVGKRRRELYKVIREGRAGERQFAELLEIMDAERKVTADYIARFRQMLPADKAAKVFVADEDFKNFLIRRAASGGSKR